MTALSHRCSELEESERTAQLVADLAPGVAATMTVTREKLFWLLQLCGVRGSLIVAIRFCPFCGQQLPP